MRKMNRLAALLAVLVMSTTMASTAFAEDPVTAEASVASTGTITVQNTVKGATYTLYKIFDATTNGTSVSYTVPEGTSEEFYTAIDTIFEIRSQGGKKYVVGLKEGKTNADLFKWLKTNGIQGKNKGSNECTGSNVTFGNLEYGYYYIHSSLANSDNGLAMAVTLQSPNVKAQEKNVDSGWGEHGGKTIATSDGEVTFRIGETIPYKVTYENAYNFHVVDEKNGTKKAHKIYQYVLEDTMPAAVTLNENSFVVTVNNHDVMKDDEITENNYTYSLETDANGNKKFRLTIPWAKTTEEANDDFFYHDAPAEIVVTYSGVLNSKVVTGSNKHEENTNKASMYYNNNIKSGDDKDAPIYSGEIKITKVDGGSKQVDGTYETKLPGATFVVKSGNNYLKYEDDAYSTTTNVNEATRYVTDGKGEVIIRGLKQGTYELVEIQAPAGYNVLNGTQSVTLEFDREFNGESTSDTLVFAPVVENFKGIQLPSTGGMGTVAFAVAGLIVMAGAAVTLIIKKRA